LVSAVAFDATWLRVASELPREPAVKIEPRLPQLPSLGELLEHPRVKGLVERVNRSTIAKRAGGFLEEIRASLAARAGRMELPSLAQLAERLARRLLGDAASAGPIINATGLVFGDADLALPLAEPALHAMVQLAGEYHCRDASAVRTVERSVCELAGGEAAHVVNSFDSAVTLVVAATAANRELLLYGDLDGASPIDWRWAAARASAMIRASTHEAPPAAAIVRAPEADKVEFAELVAAKAGGACLIDVAPIAGLMDPIEHGYESVPTIVERLTAGADLVVADGSGLFGGPACGLVIGRRQFIDAVAKHPLASLLAPEPVVVAALAATLRVWRGEGESAAIYQLPPWQLLTAPLANLEHRARRLSALLAEAADIAMAEAREIESPWRRWGRRSWMAKSWCIELRPKDGNPTVLQSKLAQGPHPIASRPADGAVQLDLRTVFPRWDQQIVTAVDGWRGPSGWTPSSGDDPDAATLSPS
jgi:L-seryl-tRNA(Ser) seleniumtransferase